jgi:hypothetical protein
MSTQCRSWRLDAVGAWTASSRHSRMTAGSTGRLKSSRLRMTRVVESSSSFVSSVRQIAHDVRGRPRLARGGDIPAGLAEVPVLELLRSSGVTALDQINELRVRSPRRLPADPLPGIGAMIAAEIGDVRRFGSAGRLCSWVGLPGRHPGPGAPRRDHRPPRPGSPQHRRDRRGPAAAGLRVLRAARRARPLPGPAAGRSCLARHPCASWWSAAALGPSGHRGPGYCQTRRVARTSRLEGWTMRRSAALTAANYRVHICLDGPENWCNHQLQQIS